MRAASFRVRVADVSWIGRCWVRSRRARVVHRGGGGGWVFERRDASMIFNKDVERQAR